MTDVSWEFEEPEPIPASHLLRVRCAHCGRSAAALAAPGQERAARCTNCIGSGVTAPELAGAYTPGRFIARPVPAEPLAGLDPHPAPEVSSRDEEPGGALYPSAVLKMAQRAREAGWDVVQQYARGAFPHATTGRPTAVRDSYALRMRHLSTGALAVMVYRDKGWSSVWLRSRHHATWFGLAGATDASAWLLAGGEVEERWYVEIRARVEAYAIAKNLKAKASARGRSAGGARGESGG